MIFQLGAKLKPAELVANEKMDLCNREGEGEGEGGSAMNKVIPLRRQLMMQPTAITLLCDPRVFSIALIQRTGDEKPSTSKNVNYNHKLDEELA